MRVTKPIFILLVAFVAGVMVPAPAPAQVSVGIGIGIHVGPPALPVYAQPVCPGVGYLWTPGYWAYGPDGYFWVPGTWVLAPTPGYLWTPGYWGWGGGGYFWHAGYWGPHVGFYGGINYGFGYVGTGFYGGQWIGGSYHYNTAVTNVNTTVVNNTYNTTVVNNTTTVNRTSYNGGTGGVTAQPTAAEQATANEPHLAPTAVQAQHQQAASTNRAMLASENHGTPAVAATPKPGAFSGPGVVAAHPVAATANGTKTAAMQNDRPPSARTSNSTSGTMAPNASSNSTTSTTPGNTANTSHPNTSKTNSHPKNSNPKPKAPSHPAEPHGGRGR
ncbi:MAG TPA: YXWGXW repeat-containing protein [Candidatus Acidoferrum sp.]|nr:YXWGXW repeat-containing protein [Candidatus Acidoferrum sp.]